MPNLYIKFYLKFVGVENNDKHPIGGANNPVTLFHCVLQISGSWSTATSLWVEQHFYRGHLRPSENTYLHYDSYSSKIIVMK